MRNKIFIHFFFILISFFVVIVSTYPKVEIAKHSELENLSCGWPLKFVVHDDSLYDPPMPWKATCGFLRAYDQGITKEFYWQYFIFDAVFYYLLILLVFYGACKGYKIIIPKS